MLGVKYIFVDVEIPIDEVNPEIVYVCRNDYRIDFICPCGCGDIVTLNMVPGKPCWKTEGNSISPSINRTIGCKSHFTITNGVTH